MKIANNQEFLSPKIKIAFFFLFSLALFLISLQIKFESILSVSLWCVYTLVCTAFFGGHQSLANPIGITLRSYLRRASCFLFIAYYLFFLTLAIGILLSNSATRPIPAIITADFIVLFFKCVTWPSIFLTFFSALSVFFVPCGNAKTAGLYFGLFASTCVLYKITNQMSSTSQIPYAIFQPIFPLLLGITFGILYSRRKNVKNLQVS